MEQHKDSTKLDESRAWRRVGRSGVVDFECCRERIRYPNKSGDAAVTSSEDEIIFLSPIEDVCREWSSLTIR